MSEHVFPHSQPKKLKSLHSQLCARWSERRKMKYTWAFRLSTQQGDQVVHDNECMHWWKPVHLRIVNRTKHHSSIFLFILMNLFWIRTGPCFSTLSLYLFYSPVLCRIFDSVKTYYNLPTLRLEKRLQTNYVIRNNMLKLYFVQSGKKWSIFLSRLPAMNTGS